MNTDDIEQSPAEMHAGPLGPHIDGFAGQLREFGYTHASLNTKLRIVADLNQWLTQRRYGAQALEERTLAEFRTASGRFCERRGDASSLRQLLAYLRERRVIPEREQAKRTPADRLVDAFDHYLTEERGLAVRSRKTYCRLVRRFIEHACGDDVNLELLKAVVVSSYVLQEASRVRPKTAKTVVAALRSFLRFLHIRGDSEIDLTGAALTVANWRQADLPKYLRPDEVKQVLESCNQETAVGRRDYAVLLMLARLGLRAGEVVDMSLDDIDWQAGKFQIRGRFGRTDRLPLPVDVGAALATYLRYGRPQCIDRHVFLRARAPFRAFSSSVAIDNIVERALKRADLAPPRKGAHLLRHTVATELLRNGSTLEEIGELLRHRHPDTTAIYAKVDLASLRGLAMAWPEVTDYE